MEGTTGPPPPAWRRTSALVAERRADLREGGVGEGSIEPAFAGAAAATHALHVQVFHDEHRMLVREPTGGVVQHVTSQVRHPRMRSCDLRGGAPPPVRRVLPRLGVRVVGTAAACRTALQPAQLRLPASRGFDAGSPLAFVWTDTDTPLDPGRCAEPVAECLRIGFERTLQQDAAFGIRQLVDIACKALSPAVNDPYTAVQAIHHLATILALLAPRPLGTAVIRPGPSASVTAPALDFDR